MLVDSRGHVSKLDLFVSEDACLTKLHLYVMERIAILVVRVLGQIVPLWRQFGEFHNKTDSSPYYTS